MSESELRREPTQLENTIEWYCKRSTENYRAELKKKIEEMIVWHDDAVLVSKQLLFDLIDQTEKP